MFSWLQGWLMFLKIFYSCFVNQTDRMAWLTYKMKMSPNMKLQLNSHETCAELQKGYLWEFGALTHSYGKNWTGNRGSQMPVQAGICNFRACPQTLKKNRQRPSPIYEVKVWCSLESTAKHAARKACLASDTWYQTAGRQLCKSMRSSSETPSSNSQDNFNMMQYWTVFQETLFF